MKKEVEIVKKDKLKLIKKRSPQNHKYNFGSLLVVGGSKKYSGSPALASLAAYRCGVDIVEVAAPERAANIIASFSPNIITWPLKGDFFSIKHIPEILELLENKTACLIGGGLGREEKTKKAIIELLSKVNIPCIIDADAIYAFAANKEKIKPNFIFLPHTYEFFVLTGKEAPDDLDKKIALVKKQAKKLKCMIVLKGNPDIISDGERTAVNKTGNPFMTVGGTGDTLSGITASLIAQKIDNFDSACIACYINGLAGDLVGKEKKQGLLATDIIEKIPELF